MYWEIKKNCVTLFIEIITLSQWFGTKPANSPRYACITIVVSVKWYLIVGLFFVAALGLYCCRGAFSSCGEWGLLSPQVGSSCSAQAALVVEHRLQGARAQLPAACGIFPDQGLNGCPLH